MLTVDQYVLREKEHAEDLAADEAARTAQWEKRIEAARIDRELTAKIAAESEAKRMADAATAEQARAYADSEAGLREQLDAFINNEPRRATFGKMPMADFGTIRQELDTVIRVALLLLDSRQ
jgi:hypothetical protein